MGKQWIAILDYGSQYTQLIARRIREMEVYSEIVRCDTTAEELKQNPPAGIILSGGPNSVFEDGAPTVDTAIFAMGLPILGICYGMQLMSYKLGGKVVPGTEREYGKMPIEITCGLCTCHDGESRIWRSGIYRFVYVKDSFAARKISGSSHRSGRWNQVGPDPACGCSGGEYFCFRIRNFFSAGLFRSDSMPSD